MQRIAYRDLRIGPFSVHVVAPLANRPPPWILTPGQIVRPQLLSAPHDLFRPSGVICAYAPPPGTSDCSAARAASSNCLSSNALAPRKPLAVLRAHPM